MRLIIVILLLFQSCESTAQAKYLIIEVKNHNIELFMNTTCLVYPSFNDSSLSLQDVTFNCYQTADSSFLYSALIFASDSIITLSNEEFQKLYYSNGYDKPDTTICEVGCMSFRFYDKNCQLISEYMLYNKLDTIKFLKQLIINCEKKMKSNEFKELFLYYIEINEDY